MNLQTLIETLSALDPTLPLRFDDGRLVRGLCSWRGSYDQLTIDTVWGDDDEGLTVGGLLADAQAAVGKTFEGYKGGDYVMFPHTAVWADEYGRYQSQGIAGITVKKGTAVINRVDLSDYR